MSQVTIEMNNNKGFTLLELLITMVLVIVVIMITGSAFESILKSTGRITSSEESNIEGQVGLEMFRHDLQQAGFGLPTAFQSIPPQYTEATVEPAKKLNDSPNNVPRAVASLESIAGSWNVLAGTDYLAIKATTVGRSSASQKWTYLAYTSSPSGKKPNQWSNQADNLSSTDRVIVLNRTFSSSGKVNNVLVYNTDVPATFWPSDPTNSLTDSAFNPTAQSQVYFLYGVDVASLGMPFNRSDYFVARPATTTQMPASCAPGTGILYKANVDHGDGTLKDYPLLDCVADMQLVFGWDVNGDGVIDESGAYDTDVANISLSSESGATKATIKAIMENPEDISNKLKYIKVYIMAQEGQKDNRFTNTNTLVSNTLSVVVGDPGPNPSSNISLTKGYNVSQLTAKGWLNYRWKIYRIMVRPKNLIAN